MRWAAKRGWSPGESRMRHGFLWLPKNIYGDVRWLEIAGWQEVLRQYRGNRKGWQAQGWLDGKK